MNISPWQKMKTLVNECNIDIINKCLDAGAKGIICPLINTVEDCQKFLQYLYDYEILVCPIKDDWHLMRIKELSCVSFIMRLIGFYRWYIITPYQLYCALLKAGYKPFWNKSK